MARDVVRIDVTAPNAATLPKRVSYSQMSLYQQCGLKFFFNYLGGWKEPPSAALACGVITHEIIEQIYRLAPPERNVVNALEIMRELGPQLMQKPEYQVFANDNNVKHQIRDAVESLFEVETPHELNVLPEHLEMDLNVEINGVNFTGKVDRFTSNEVNRVTDYKTGRSPGKYVNDKLAQPYLYALAFKLQYDIEVDELELIYLNAKEVVRRDNDQAVMISMGDKLAVMSTDSQRDFAENAWDAKVQRLCDYCAFQEVCPARNPNAAKPGSTESDSALREMGLTQRLRGA